MSEINLDTLRAFRAQTPSCTLVVLSDARSGTVLLAHGDLTCPQEYLDAVSAFALDALALVGPASSYALFHTPQNLRLVVRGGARTDLALSAIAAPDAAPGPLLAALSELAVCLSDWATAA